jgi:hypothetical protein
MFVSCVLLEKSYRKFHLRDKRSSPYIFVVIRSYEDTVLDTDIGFGPSAGSLLSKFKTCFIRWASSGADMISRTGACSSPGKKGRTQV